MTEFNVNSKLPDLVVEGDVMLKEFNFLVDNKIDKPVKIGRVGKMTKCDIHRIIIVKLMVRVNVKQKHQS